MVCCPPFVLDLGACKVTLANNNRSIASSHNACVLVKFNRMEAYVSPHMVCAARGICLNVGLGVLRISVMTAWSGPGSAVRGVPCLGTVGGVKGKVGDYVDIEKWEHLWVSI